MLTGRWEMPLISATLLDVHGVLGSGRQYGRGLPDGVRRSIGGRDGAGFFGRWTRMRRMVITPSATRPVQGGLFQSYAVGREPRVR